MHNWYDVHIKMVLDSKEVTHASYLNLPDISRIQTAADPILSGLGKFECTCIYTLCMHVFVCVGGGGQRL